MRQGGSGGGRYGMGGLELMLTIKKNRELENFQTFGGVACDVYKTEDCKLDQGEDDSVLFTVVPGLERHLTPATGWMVRVENLIPRPPQQSAFRIGKRLELTFLGCWR